MCTMRCTIEFENDNECYRPGEVIKGLVNLDIIRTSLLKALSLQFTGYAYTNWVKTEKGEKSENGKTFVEYRDDYVSTTNYLLGSEMANLKRVELGKYNYNFMINIPQDIPSTFCTPLGFIRYELTVNADYGDHITTLYNNPIRVKQLKDLRLMDSFVRLPAEVDQLELKSRITFWKQPLQLYASIPQKAFTPGEHITIHIKLVNHSKSKLQAISCNLNRVASYKGLKKGKTSETTTEVTPIASNLHNLYGQTSKHTQAQLEVFVPETPPTMTFDECKCINLSYELEVLATCQNKKRWVRATIPISIGSISLSSEVKIVPAKFNNKTVAAITVAKSMEELNLPSAIDFRDDLTALQATNIRSSTSSLASTFKEANFMTPADLAKTPRHQIVGDTKNFKPKYLYYDLPKDFPHNITPNN